MKYKYLLLLLLMLPFVSACDTSDDVLGIFTGKTWKLTYITKAGDHQPYDFWNDQAKLEESMKTIRKEGAFTVNFTGSEINKVISGAFNGKIIAAPFSGKWTANGESGEFSTSSIEGSESDPLALGKKFIEGIRNAKSYRGDYNNLFLFYKDEAGRDLCLAFSPVK